MATSPRSRLSQDELLLAVPKKGRLCERVVKILEGAGLEHRRVRQMSGRKFQDAACSVMTEVQPKLTRHTHMD
jgi:ATP phosphoribosyltransferase